jgi:hypothetical protein
LDGRFLHGDPGTEEVMTAEGIIWKGPGDGEKIGRKNGAL